MIKDNISFIDTLTDAIGRCEDQKLDEVINDLKEGGIDVDASMKRMMSSIDESIRRSKYKILDLAREERLKSKANSGSPIDKFVDWTKDMIIDGINKIISNNQDMIVGAAYRDLVKKDVDDLRALLQDLETTLIIKKCKINKNEEGN